MITTQLRERLWPFRGSIARANKMKILSIGGVADHVHSLLPLPGTMAIAKVMQLIRGGSSKWVLETFPGQRLLACQVKSSAFSGVFRCCGESLITSKGRRNITGK